MKYAVINVVNGNFAVAAEGFTNVDSAIVNYHGLCQSLWNASDVQTACVMIIDENMNTIGGYKENIKKTSPNG